MEGFGEVVICTGLEPFDLVLPAAAGSKNQDGKIAALGAERTNQLDAGNSRQTEVDNGQVLGVFAAEVQAVFAVGGLVDRVTETAEVPSELFAQGASRWLFECPST